MLELGGIRILRSCSAEGLIYSGIRYLKIISLETNSIT